MEQLSKYSHFVGRVLLASVFLVSGLNKLTGFTGVQDYMESVGVPGTILPFIVVLELAGSLMLIVNWKTPWAAAALAVFSLATAFIFHSSFDNQMQQFMFMKNMAIAGGLILLIHPESQPD